MFIPATIEERDKLSWDQFDIILVSGDTYIDHYSNGASLIGHYLISKGFKVGIIAQPEVNSDADIKRLGEPRLFWGVTAGAVDSMISNYTSAKKRRNDDDLSPGGVNNKRPDRATIVYCNLIRRYFKNTVPIVIGGVEASLRRTAHYDYWNNEVRRSILFDSRADILIYGMAEKAVLEVAQKLAAKENYREVKGLCFISESKADDFIELPEFEKVKNDKNEFIKMFDLFYYNNEPLTAKGLYQKHNDKYLIHNPPMPYLTENELDEIYNLQYERKVHPYYLSQGIVKAMDTVQFSITTHRGCYGECNFCSIALHQGRQIVSRSESSIIKEAKEIILQPDFKGSITISAPTANMYKNDCGIKAEKGACKNKRCIYPEICSELHIDHMIHLNLLRKLKTLNGIKNVFVTSGLRYDLILMDEKSNSYMADILNYHTSGQLKIAPEHTDSNILDLMGKPGSNKLLEFIKLFKKTGNNQEKKKYLTYYFIAAHPGCDLKQMQNLKVFISKNLRIIPEQVQIFTPSPSTFSTLMYFTEINPFNKKTIFVEKNIEKKRKQKQIIGKKL